MEGILNCTIPGIKICILWRQIAGSALLAAVLACLYIFAWFQSTAYDSLPQGRSASPVMNGQTGRVVSGMFPEIALGITKPTVVLSLDERKEEARIFPEVNQKKKEDLNVQVMTSSDSHPAETPLIVVCLYGNGGMPEKTIYSCESTNIEVDAFQRPRRLGKEFTGWYLDPACTMPFTGVEGTPVNLALYAGWKEFDGFVSDENGRIIGCTSPSVATDGILTFPRSMDCTGIERNSLGGLEEEVIEVYIPSNITYIAPGAFDHLHLLMFIEVAEDNPAYYSEDGILYAADGEIIAYPGGR